MTKYTAVGLIGMLIAMASIAEPTDLGTYSATGEKPGTPAPIGSYVPSFGATTATIAPPGPYVSNHRSLGRYACIPRKLCTHLRSTQ